jgi:peptidoglycan/LPS O-acetylase OafA/YrhL
MSRHSRLAGHLRTLDGWRAVAVLMVIAAHVPQSAVPGLRPLGGLGVSLFFGLSGSLICTRLLAEHEARGRFDLGGFYIRRVFRILPPAFAYLAVLSVLTAVGLLAVPSTAIRSCLLVTRNYVAAHDWYTAHFWSLAVEEHFYLAFPLLLAWTGPRRGLWLAIGLAAAVAGWRWADGHWHLLAGLSGVVPQYYRTDCRLDELTLGCAAALLAYRHADKLGGRIVGLAAWAGTLLIVAAAFGVAVPGSLRAALVPWAMVGTVVRPHVWLGRVLEWPPMAWLGRLSYSVYLWHALFLVGYADNRAAGLRPWQDWPWNAVAVLACAAASHYLLERPLTRLGRALADRRSIARSQVTAYRVMLGSRRSPVATRPVEPVK